MDNFVNMARGSEGARVHLGSIIRTRGQAIAFALSDGSFRR